MIAAVLSFILFTLLVVSCQAKDSAASTKLWASTCEPYLSALKPKVQIGLLDILPNERFVGFFSSTASGGTILLLDVDKHTWKMSLNHAISLKRAGSEMVVHVLAYEPNICGNFAKYEVPCFYDADWLVAMDKAYIRWTGREILDLKMLSVVMMGRMVASLFAMCEGYNVFLSDADVVFYRNPLDYVFDNVDMMVTSTLIGPSRDWGAPFFVDRPKKFYTLNNGVIYYRNNPKTQAFMVSLTGDSIAHLMKGPDRQLAFLQTTFNQYMQKHNLYLYPTRKVSDKSTFKLNKKLSNKAGECYDCYHGEIVTSKITTGIFTAKKEMMRVGVFPMERYVSLCSAKNITDTNLALAASARAMRLNETNLWGWGELPGSHSRLLAVHANCINNIDNDSGYTAARFEKKENWFRSINSWFL